MSEPSNWRILIIDDEADVREVAALALADEGYVVDTAVDGLEGVERCREFDPHIVITDIRMPRMDGLQVLEHIKRHQPRIEVIVVTAFGDIPLAVRALHLDASDFVTKPLDHEALQAALRRAMERYTSRKQLRDHLTLLEQENVATARDLARSIRFQHNLIESSMDAILGCGPDGRVLVANRSMAQLAGMPREQLLGETGLDILFSSEERDRFERELDGENFGGRNRLSLFAGEIRGGEQRNVPVHISAARLFDGDEVSGMVLFLRDLREFRRLESKLEDQVHTLLQDKMIALGRLAASVVHEINNPLTGILNYVRLMRKQLRKGDTGPDRLEKFDRYLELVDREITHCSHITANLLAFTRKSTPALEPVALPQLVENVLLLCGHKLALQKIGVETDVPADLPPVKGDANQLQQCLINLILNAMDAMPRGGRLTISGRFEPGSGRIVLRIRDTGGGIAEKDRPFIFDHFFTTKQQGYGVGLGLSTVQGILQRIGGDVRVENTGSSGSTFRLELPAAAGGS